MPHLGYCPDCEYLGDQPAEAAAEEERSRARLTSALVATVVFLTAIAPLATDMYVPAFPQVATDLTATATQVQLTLTTFFVGMALGQLIGGPVSDQRGRRRLLIAAVARDGARVGGVCARADDHGHDGRPVRPRLRRRLGHGHRPRGHRRPRHRRPARPGAERDGRRRRHRPHRRASDRRRDPAAVALAGLVLGGCRPRRGHDDRRVDRRARDAAPRAAAQRRAAGIRRRGPSSAAQPQLRGLPGRRGLGHGRPVRLCRHVGIRAAVDERAVPDRLLHRLRRERRRHDHRRPDRRSARRPGRHPHRHHGRPDRRPRRRCRDADRRRSGSTRR